MSASWDLIAQVLSIEGVILNTVREETSVAGIKLTDLLEWISTEHGAQAMNLAIRSLLATYTAKK